MRQNTGANGVLAQWRVIPLERDKLRKIEAVCSYQTFVQVDRTAFSGINYVLRNPLLRKAANLWQQVFYYSSRTGKKPLSPNDLMILLNK